MKKILFSIFCLLNTVLLYATHNRAGEITYTHLSGYTYKITVTTYTKESSKAADRCSLTVHFGDGDSAVLYRVNGPKGTLCGGTIPEGELLGNDVKKNIYEGTHAYKGEGTYKITMEDPNRNAQICNLGNASDQLSFFLQAVLVINPLFSPNSSVTLLYPPTDDACVNTCFSHNPGAYDMDGDSLYYSLVPCFANGQPVASYTFPDGMTAESIDHLKGTVRWCNPPTICSYNIAILIEEWKYVESKRYFAGSVLRDMQINVGTCSNLSPKFNEVKDTFVVANETLHFSVKAIDPDLNKLTLKAAGNPFLVTGTVFHSNDSVQTATGDFNWTSNCKVVNFYPYQVTFKVSDNAGTNPLTDFMPVHIRVIAPAVTNASVHQLYRASEIKWENLICNDSVGMNGLTGYDIYRKDNCDNWQHKPGETGVPVSAGYQQIAFVPAPVTEVVDDNNGAGLIVDAQYTYIIVAKYRNGAQSYASQGVCTTVTSIKKIGQDISLQIFPNPSPGAFTITSDFYSDSKVNVSVKNNLGQVVYKENCTFDGNNKTIVVDLTSGIYFLEIISEKGTVVRKISIQN